MKKYRGRYGHKVIARQGEEVIEIEDEIGNRLDCWMSPIIMEDLVQNNGDILKWFAPADISWG